MPVMLSRLLNMARMIQSRRYRFTTLLVFLFALFLVYPIILELPKRLSLLGIICVDTLTAAVLVASVNIAGKVHRLRRVLLIIAIPVVALIAVSYIDRNQSGDNRVTAGVVVFSMHLLVILFLSIMMVTILRHVLEGGRITIDEINGAVCVYMLMGLAGAYIFALIEFLHPGSFDLPPVEAEYGMMLRREHFPSLLYYSLVTLTTLGYGDISPQTPLARTIASLQAVFGQVYLAVLVARLVGMHIAHSQHQDSETD
jgi:hypothetical protein